VGLLRKLFLNEVLHEGELGTDGAGLGRQRVIALVAPVKGRPELFVEWRRKAPLAWAVDYLHLPEDGLESIESVAKTILGGSWPAPTLSERRALTFYRLAALPIKLVVLTGFIGGLSTAVGWIRSDVFWGLFPVLMGLLVFSVISQFLCTAFVSGWLGEPIGAGMARAFYGHVFQVDSMGTWRGPLGKAGFASGGMSGALHVMGAEGSSPLLVMTRSHRTWFSAGVHCFHIPGAQLPGLLDAISVLRRCQDEARGLSPAHHQDHPM
jgi:hypothetical protein